LEILEIQQKQVPTQKQINNELEKTQQPQQQGGDQTFLQTQQIVPQLRLPTSGPGAPSEARVIQDNRVQVSIDGAKDPKDIATEIQTLMTRGQIENFTS